MTLNRRDFIRASALGLAAGALPRPLLALARAEFTPIRRNVGFFTERGGTIGWLVNSDGVAVVDSQFPDAAGVFLDGLRERTDRRIDLLINSHHHPDHIGGNGVLRPVSGRIVAHEQAVANQRRVAAERGNGPEETYADTTYTDRWSETVGDERIHLTYFGPAHTGGDSAIYFEEANVVHLGDLLNNRGFPNIDPAAGGTVGGWIRVLDAIAAEYPADAVYIFGHAGEGFPLTGTLADLHHQRDYFLALLDHAGRGLRAGRSRDEVIAMETLPGFEHFGGTRSRLGLGLGIAYDELQAGR